MPTLIINRVSFRYPDPGQEPGWGEDATAWAEAVTEALAFLINPGDIINSTAAIQNNVSSATDVVGCLFDSTQTRTANVNYQIIRETDLVSISETGTIILNYNPNGTWTLTHTYTGDESGVTFSINNLGQVQYTSTNLAGTGYIGEMKFNAKTLPQV